MSPENKRPTETFVPPEIGGMVADEIAAGVWVYSGYRFTDTESV